jgi:4a-hydroxytetrahydrobiopterin dehydratase
MQLKDMMCVACKGDTPILKQGEVEEYLNLLEGWTRKGKGAIERTVKRKNFLDALRFLNIVARIAEVENHHPDMGIVKYQNVHLVLTTHAVKGLTKNDFIVAAKIDALVRAGK